MIRKITLLGGLMATTYIGIHAQMYTVNQNGQAVLPTTPFRNSFASSSTWGMQFGIRYSF